VCSAGCYTKKNLQHAVIETMSFSGRTRPCTSGHNDKPSSLKRPSSAPAASTRPTAGQSSSSSRPGSATLFDQQRSRPSQPFRPSSASDNKAAAATPSRNARPVRHVTATPTPASKSRDVTALGEPLSSSKQVLDKKRKPSSGGGGGLDSQEVCSNSRRAISGTDADVNNKQDAVGGEVAGDRLREPSDIVLTSGPSQATATASAAVPRSSAGQSGQFTAGDAGSPRRREGFSSAGGSGGAGAASSAAGRAASLNAEVEAASTTDAGRPTKGDRDRGVGSGLMCRDGAGKVVNDASGSRGDVTAMAKLRKSPDPFRVDDDDVITTGDDEMTLRRQNSVLSQLLSAKKMELDEASQLCSGRINYRLRLCRSCKCWLRSVHGLNV